MRALLDELLDYNRATLSLGLRVQRSPCDLAAVCEAEVELRRQAHPGHAIDWRASGATGGLWDASRIQQALGNLIANAARHGDEGGAIGVDVQGADDAVTIVVSNRGPAIAPEAIGSIFDPLRSSADPGRDDATHLGLGLFVVKEVAIAHGGSVHVDSGAELTRFRMRLPKKTPAAGAPLAPAAA
jgi:signal transduction histidine kinase